MTLRFTMGGPRAITQLVTISQSYLSYRSKPEPNLASYIVNVRRIERRQGCGKIEKNLAKIYYLFIRLAITTL